VIEYLIGYDGMNYGGGITGVARLNIVMRFGCIFTALFFGGV
jgi:hypothetical protein